MKKNTRFQILFSSLVTASLLLFMSCGHQRTKENDGLFADMDRERNLDSQEVNVPTEGEQKAEVAGDLAATSHEEHAKEVVPVEEDLAATKNIDPMSLGNEEAKPEANAAASLDAAPPVAESMPPMEPTLEAPLASKGESKLEGPSALLPPVDEKMGDALAQLSVPTADGAEATATEPAPAPKKVRRAKKAGVKVPEVPSESVWKKGHTLNRYYFLRPNDTAEKVSEMVYGDAARSEDLKMWNQGEWKTGRIVMFPSATTPDDTEMKSIYDERALASQTYTVKEGEKLSQIAEATYGDSKSWVEIAALNHLKSDKVAGGTTLNLYPTELAVVAPAAEAQVAKVEEKAPEAAVVAAQEPAKQEPVPAPAATPKKVVKKAKLANASVGGVFEEHIAAIFGAGLILMASFFAFRYFRRNRELQD